VSTVVFSFCPLGLLSCCPAYLYYSDANTENIFCESYNWHFDTCILSPHNTANQNLQML